MKKYGLMISVFLILAWGAVVTPAQADTTELSYDDGSVDTSIAAVAGWELVVNFSLPMGWTSAKISTARYYIYSDPAAFNVRLYDSSGNELITPFSATPTATGWFDVDLSGLNIVVSGDFYIVMEWETAGVPRLASDTSAPIDLRSYGGSAYPWTISYTTADLMIRAVVESPLLPTIESCDSAGDTQDMFNPSEDVYVVGSGFEVLPTIDGVVHDIYVVNDVAWSDGMSIPTRVPGTATTVPLDEKGDIIPTLVWSNPLTPGEYDIVVDVNGNGVYDEGVDALDDSDIEVTAGFLVIPEYSLGTILGLIAFFAAFGVFMTSRRRN